MHQVNCAAGALCSGSVIIGPREPPRRHPPGGGSPRPGQGPGNFPEIPEIPPPARGAPGGPKSAQNRAEIWPQIGPKIGPFWTRFWRPIYILLYYRNPPRGARFDPPFGVHFGAPRGGPPGGPPGGAKKCTFFWVFNNSPSRDSLSPFFAPPILGQFGTVWGTPPWDSVYRTA